MGSRIRCLKLLMLIVLTTGGCGDNDYQVPPPPVVTVAVPMQRDVIEYAEQIGRTVVASSVDVRARVSGILQQVSFEPGAKVEAGDALFVIDPVPFEATRDAMQAQVESAEAQLRLAETMADRIERSSADGAIREIEALQSRAEADAAAAALLVAQKELAIKQLDVNYTHITAPISGWIERSPFGTGDLVGNSADASLLTTVYDDSTMNVYFTVPDRIYLQAIRRDDPDAEPPKVEMATELDDGYPFVGVIDYVDPTVDETTGTVQVRAVVQNEDRRLLGGLFVRVRLAVQTLENALLVPQAAIGTDQVGSYVVIVDADGVVQRRDIQLGPVDGPDRVVTSGLSADDRVVIRGLLKARPGATVNAVESGS